MTVLAALWNHDGRPAVRECGAMLQAQSAIDGGSLAQGSEGPVLGCGDLHRGLHDVQGGGPVDGASGALTLVADVRLDNRAELLSGLGLGGPDWAGCSDPRLMMACFERWGGRAVDAFVGDFALMLWDRREGSLLLARDFAATRPLFFCAPARAVAVASLARGLHALDFAPRGVDETAMLEVLAGLPHEGRRTFFRGIDRVEPGEALTFRRGGSSSRTFWTPPTESIRLRSPGEYAEALNEKLDEAVAARLRGVRGALGTHLSAGLDSSAVTAAAARLWKGRIHAFTAVPSEPLPCLPEGRFGNEGVLAAQTAAMYPNIDHHLVSNGTRIPIEDLRWQLELFERSDLNLPNLAWTANINDVARDAGVEVMLIATTGNATISYGGLDILRDFLAEGRIGTFLAETIAARIAGVGTRALLGAPARHVLPRFLLRALGRLRKQEQHPAFAGAIDPSAPGAAEIVGRFERHAMQDFANSTDARMHMLRRADPATFHKGILIRWNIDFRDPTVDRRLVEFCLQVPLHQYFRNGTSRALIRTALKGRIPEAVRCNAARGLQSADWFSRLSEARAEMRHLLAGISRCEAARSLLDIDEMHRRLESWPESSEGAGSMAYRYGLLRGLSAGEFIRLHSVRD